MREFVVAGAEAGGRFDKYLKRLLPEASAGFLYKMLRKKNITLNDKKAEGKEILAEKDVVKLFFSEETYLKFAGRFGEVSGRNEADEENKDFVKMPEKDCQKEGFSRCPDRDCLKRYSFRKSGMDYRKAYQQLGKIPVIYEDDDILILNKPAGVLSQKAKKEDVSLNEWMIGYLLEKKEVSEEGLSWFRPSVCNRLDRNTSGLLLCGKSLRGSRYLSEILRDRSLHKYYLAYVQGKIKDPITLNGYLKKAEEKNISEIISEEEYQQKIMTEAMVAETGYRQKSLGGKSGRKTLAKDKTGRGYQKIETIIKPLSYFKEMNCTKLEILLITGKSHQIRAHLAAVGHPVIGDIKYGWKPKSRADVEWKYQLLHAHRMEFPKSAGTFAHLSGKVVIAPLPEEFEKMEGQLWR